jgi:CheY-like chemotaxis protein
VDLNYLLGDLRKMLGRLLREDIQVNADLDEDLWTVEADTGNINQIITNLSVNARDAMPVGGTLHIATHNVMVDEVYCRQFREARAGRFVCLTVSDTGIGMDEQVRSRLFEPFFTTKGPGKGTGLGLSVVYGIVRAHEGWITVHSRPGEGTRLEIYFPAKESEARPFHDEPGSGRLAEYRGNGERILLVEDESALRDMTAQVLRELNYSVHACGTLSDAFSACREEDGSFDLILSDVVLPDGRGTDLVLRLTREQPSLAALLVTGYTDDASEWERVREAGLLLLQKPVPTPELLGEIRKALEGRTDVRRET